MAELESEGEMSRVEAATFLAEFAEDLVDGADPREVYEEEFVAEEPETDTMTLMLGGDSATFAPPETLELEVELESSSSFFRDGVEQSVEFELSWEVEEPIDDDRIEVR